MHTTKKEHNVTKSITSGVSRHCIDVHGPAVFSDDITCADYSQHRHLYVAWVINLLFQLTTVTLVLLYVIDIVFQINGTYSPFINVFVKIIIIVITRSI